MTNSLALIFRAAFVQGFNAMGDLFSVVLVGAVLAAVDPLLAAVSAGYFALVAFGYHRAARRVMDRAAYEVHVGEAIDLQTVRQPLAAVKEVKLRGAEDHFADDVHDVRTRLLPPHRAMALSSVLPRYVLELAMVGAAALIALVSFTTEPVGTAAATVGVFLVGGFRMLAPLNKVIFGFTQARGALPSLDQVRADLEPREEPLPVEPATVDPGELRPWIRLRDVSFGFVPDVRVLEDVTLEVEPGEWVGFVGASGAGKSTLVDVILGVLDPQQGEVLIGDWPIRSVRTRWQRMIGYVPQSVVLFDDTVRANVALGCRPDEVDDEQLRHVLSLAQLDDVVRSLADGLDQVVGEDGVQLSGGQRQRLGIARALYHDPRVLIFDEATSALDSETEFKLNQVLDGLRGRFTTITIAHRLSTVRRCDRLWYLDQGRVLAEGTFEQLDARIAGFARMVELSRVDP
jgi:ABC-type multidrug transport system fused ATPase/permease subunit